MSAWTRAIAANARCSAAPSAAVGPRALTSTKVPRSGWARLRLPKGDRIGGDQAPDAVGDVARGERRTAQVADVAVEQHGVGSALADELLAPLLVAHLPAVGLAVVEYLDRPDAAVGVDADGVADRLVLADDGIDDERRAVRRAPQAQRAARDGHPGDARDLIDLRRAQREWRGDERDAREH